LNKSQLTALIFDIQSFSVHDGPGVRTTVFFKGCPLHCPWCHSPESKSFLPQLSWIAQKCAGPTVCSNRCIDACTYGALKAAKSNEGSPADVRAQKVLIDRSKCTNCGDCCQQCYPGALSICGRQYTCEELLARVLRDRIFFRDDGGVTLSGGECLCQPQFVSAFLQMLKKESIHTAVDTTGHAPWETIKQILPYTDLFLYDLKHMDSQKHREYTGVGNELIIENAKRIAAAGGKLQIRVPIIPKFNDDEDNLTKTAEFCITLGSSLTSVQLLPYHNYGVAKHLRISDKPVSEAVPPSDAFVEGTVKLFSGYGLPVGIH